MWEWSNFLSSCIPALGDAFQLQNSILFSIPDGLNVIGLTDSINFYGLPRVWHLKNSTAVETPRNLSIRNICAYIWVNTKLICTYINTIWLKRIWVSVQWREIKATSGIVRERVWVGEGGRAFLRKCLLFRIHRAASVPSLTVRAYLEGLSVVQAKPKWSKVPHPSPADALSFRTVRLILDYRERFGKVARYTLKKKKKRNNSWNH